LRNVNGMKLVFDGVGQPTAYVEDEDGNRLDEVVIPDEWWDDMPPDREVKKLARKQCPILKGRRFTIESPC
jgi:hypothetical protein